MRLPTHSQSDLKLVDHKSSELDATQKYIFDLRGQEVEFSYLHKGDGKDIIVCPCQTSCKMGCTFCFLTGMGLPVVNLTSEDILAGIRAVIQEAGLPKSQELLVSFMGSGEPLLNHKQILDACNNLYWNPVCEPDYKKVRFAVATMMPSAMLMQEFTMAFAQLPMKLHLSLHSPFDEIRGKLMPNAVPAKTSLELLRKFQIAAPTSRKAIEIHYTLIDGLNDREEDQQELIKIFTQAGLPLDTTIKFLDFKSRPDAEVQGSRRVEEFRKALHKVSLETEFYAPPGSDIGSSCGQFVRTKVKEGFARVK